LASGLYILSDNAIIGSIRELSRYQAKGVLITDKSSHIPVYIRSAQTKPMGVLSGLGNGQAKISKVKFHEKIKVGDPVHVQIQPGRLEVPIVVGRVSQCKQSVTEPLLWDILMEPASDLTSINRIEVIVARE
jgi:cell shape-determining protein MreC